MVKKIMSSLSKIRRELWIKRRIQLFFEALTMNFGKMRGRQNSYSQLGEDRTIAYYLKYLKIKDSISYVDIGANHPFIYSNTALLDEIFHINKGILIEPNYDMFLELKKNRHVVCENIGITGNEMGEGENELVFYVMNESTLNTFKYEEVKENEQRGYKLLETRKVPVMHINDLLKKYFENDVIDVLTIDVEGMDDEIVKAIDYEKYQPLLMCVETSHADRDAIDTFMDGKGYKVFGLTCENTIYVKKEN